MRARIFALLFLFGLTPAVADEAPVKEEDGTIAVEGRGEFHIHPEAATLSIEQSARAETLEEAQRQGGEAASADLNEIAKWKTKGLTVTGHNFSVAEIRPVAVPNTPPRKPEWVASDTYSLRLEPLTSLNDVIAGLISAGTRIKSIGFTVKDERAPLLAARKLAAADAREQAKAYAEALGVELGGIKSVSDGEAQPVVEGFADLPTRRGVPGVPPMNLYIPDAIAFTASVRVAWRIGKGARAP